jgi:uncharacterized membrane protein
MRGALFLVILACGDAEETGILIENETGDWSGYACDTAPSVTWENWGRGFFTTHCQGCHASTSPDRYGASEGVYFDSLADLRVWSERVRVRVIEDEDMPPAGGLTEDDRFLLETLLDCGI